MNSFNRSKLLRRPKLLAENHLRYFNCSCAGTVGFTLIISTQSPVDLILTRFLRASWNRNKTWDIKDVFSEK